MKAHLIPAMRAVHIRVDHAAVTDNLCRYIKEGLAPLGITHLVIEFNPGYVFKCFPELSFGDFGREHAQKVAAAAKEAGIEIIPLFMCLGHQGWRLDTSMLLKVYPEFIERPHLPTEAEHLPHDLFFYCHSWCASNDKVYDYVLPMIDEIMEDFGADMIHVGMDEVFDLAESTCPCCSGKTRPFLFARTVNILHDHIVREKGWQMLMWADRLNNAKEFGYHAWEGDIWDTWKAIDLIPKDIIMADWHYDMNEQGFRGIERFIEKGFTVLPAAWRKLDQTQYLLDEALKWRDSAKEKGYSGAMAGMMVTSWNNCTNEFLDAMLPMLKDRIQEEPEIDPDTPREKRPPAGIAASIVHMAEKLKDYQP
ncbi:MAG: family 20 glycosylhydrolase [Defluviitaleaceae bacterium]|nr:family 20 glycosylhydrolase [Defluviitaleaceae bacterium]